MTRIRTSAPRRPRRAGAVLLSAASAIFILINTHAGAQSPGTAQSPARLVLEVDKSKPRQKPEQPAGKSKDVGKKVTSTSQATQTQDAPQAAAAAQSCDFTLMLLMDDIRIAYVNVYNYPPNSTVPVTITQTTPGVVGFSATPPPAATFTQTLNITVQTDGSGNGQSADFFIEGEQLGDTIIYGQTPYGPTTSIGLSVLPQCNCPPIPVVQ
jgi:hypothetical protein